MNTDLISNQIALFFSKVVKLEDLKAIKSWMTDECNFELINSFGIIDDAPPDFPLLQTKKIEDTTRYRINVAKSRLDIFVEPMKEGSKYENLKGSVIEYANKFIEKLYDLGVELVRIGCVSTVMEKMPAPEEKTRNYVSSEVWNKVDGQEIIDASIRINTKESVSIGERQFSLNKIFQVISGSGFINGIEYKGMVMSLDVNNIPGEVLTKEAAVDLFAEMSNRVTEGEIVTRLLN